MDAVTIRAIRRRRRLQKEDPVLWLLETIEWRGGYDVGGGYWQSQCLFCEQMPPVGKGREPYRALDKKKFGHKRGCIVPRAFRAHRLKRKREVS